jgi:hypothetical protein
MATTGNKTLDKLATKYLAAIDDISDERNLGDGFWIYLKKPFFNAHMESRIIHEQKLSDCISELKRCVNNPITEEEYFSRFNPTIP